jgi:nucleotide exchange factor SIL1
MLRTTPPSHNTTLEHIPRTTEDTLGYMRRRDPTIRMSRQTHIRRYGRIRVHLVLGITFWISLLSLLFLVVPSSFSYIGCGCQAKEVDVTTEWQQLGENDTIPAGMHVRIDMTTGEKWVKLIDDDDDDDDANDSDNNNKKKNVDSGRNYKTGNARTDRSNVGAVSMSIIREDGTVRVDEADIGFDEYNNNDNGSNNSTQQRLDYEMMYRTLSKLPDDEKARMGGLPELPQGEGNISSIRLTSEERKAFEKRMAEIWERRQEELAMLQEMVADMPDLLRERISSMKEYLKNPDEELKRLDLDKVGEEDVVTHILSVLEDLEFQLSDIDMARDFHTMGGWPLLMLLISEDAHIPTNKKISSLSRSTEAKVRAIQAQAAWASGTMVKNTGEFFPFVLQPVRLGDGKTTTAIDLLIGVFCKDYKDSHSWAIRTLLSKSIYAIGSMLRGNRLAQIHLLATGGFNQVWKKYLALVQGGVNSANAKLVQRLVMLGTDIVEEVLKDRSKADSTTNAAILENITSHDWCGATCSVLTSEVFLPLPVQEALLRSIVTTAPYCDWRCEVTDMERSIKAIQEGWMNQKDDFDEEHLSEIQDIANSALSSLHT